MKSSPITIALVLAILPIIIMQIPAFASAGLIASGVSVAAVLILNTVMRILEVVNQEQSTLTRSANTDKTKWFWLG